MTDFSTPQDPARELRQLVATGRFREAVETYRTTEDRAWRSLPEVQLLAATGATRLGDFELAQPLADAAAVTYRRGADRPGRMRATNLLGALAWEQGAVGAAESHFGEALALAHELADSLMAARAANNLATLAHMGNRAETALSLYRTALVTYQRIGDRQGLIETYHNLGIVFRQSAQLAPALEANDNAVRLAEATGEAGLIAPALVGLADAHIATGDTQLAVREATRAQELARQAEDPLVVAEASRILARAMLALDDLERALTAASEARRIATEYRSRLLEAEATATLALVTRAMGREADALTMRAAALAIFDELQAAGYLAEFEREWNDDTMT